MKQRCLNPKCVAFKNYGARGIGVCEEWLTFEPFLAWALSSGYESGKDLDRIDNSSGYSPENCRWATRRDNVNNRRMTIMLTVNGETKPRTEWEQIAGVCYGTAKVWVEKHGKEYAESRIAEAIANGYKKGDYGYSHRRRVLHVESGTEFDSFESAARHFGISSCAISNSIREHRRTRVGTFVRKERD